jgi:hypothetical protein
LTNRTPIGSGDFVPSWRWNGIKFEVDVNNDRIVSVYRMEDGIFRRIFYVDMMLAMAEQKCRDVCSPSSKSVTPPLGRSDPTTPTKGG